MAWTLKNYFTSRTLKDLAPNMYYIIPFIMALVLNQTLIAEKGADAMARVATIKLNTKEGSINQRLRYYEDVLTHIKDKVDDKHKEKKLHAKLKVLLENRIEITRQKLLSN